MKTASALARYFRLLNHVLLKRRLPHGLMSWRYLLPTINPRVQLHRHLWWASGNAWPRSVWCVIQGLLWLRWNLWSAWWASGRTIARLGPTVRAKEGISLTRQTTCTLRLALGWCIPPSAVYRFGLYRTPEQALDYVFDHEGHAYHVWRSRPLGLTKATMRLLQDKVVFAEQMRALGVQVAPTSNCVAHQCASVAIQSLVTSGNGIFCKSRSGHRGIGAFSAWRTSEGLQGQTFEGVGLPNSGAVENAWQQLLERDDALVQPRLMNHPDLAPMVFGLDGSEAITVRLISQWSGARLEILSATIEVPAGRHSATGNTIYAIFPIDADTGVVLRLPANVSIRDEMYGRYEKMISLKKGTPVPYWNALVTDSGLAHGHFKQVKAIAWDWVITRAGPVLLEGNFGWGCATPQQFQGGLLALDDKVAAEIRRVAL